MLIPSVFIIDTKKLLVNATDSDGHSLSYFISKKKLYENLRMSNLFMEHFLR